MLTKEACEGLSLLDILLLPLFLTVVRSLGLKNAFHLRLWKWMQNNFLFLMKVSIILSSLRFIAHHNLRSVVEQFHYSISLLRAT